MPHNNDHRSKVHIDPRDMDQEDSKKLDEILKKLDSIEKKIEKIDNILNPLK